MPTDVFQKYFKPADREDWSHIVEKIRNVITIQHHNLISMTQGTVRRRSLFTGETNPKLKQDETCHGLRGGHENNGEGKTHASFELVQCPR